MKALQVHAGPRAQKALRERGLEGAPHGAYRDGGIAEYHLHLNYASMRGVPGAVPHFQAWVIRGWLDRALKHRHRSSPFLVNLVVSRKASWIATLPQAKLPDRSDFKRFAEDVEGCIRVWSRAVAESQRLRGEFTELVGRGGGFDAQAL